MNQIERDLLSSYLKNFVDTHEVKNLGNDWFQVRDGLKVYLGPLEDAWSFARSGSLYIDEDSYPNATDAIVEFELLFAKHKRKN